MKIVKILTDYYQLDTQTGSISKVCRLPGLVGCAAAGTNGAVYFACGKGLYEVIPDRIIEGGL